MAGRRVKESRDCLHCGTAFIPRFGREQCCSKSCAGFIREGNRDRRKANQLTANDYLRGAF